jgi:hypothetical protein
MREETAAERDKRLKLLLHIQLVQMQMFTMMIDGVPINFIMTDSNGMTSTTTATTSTVLTPTVPRSVAASTHRLPRPR